MAILTKAQLEALNQSSFPNNNAGAITPEILRTYNTATIDTLVNSLDTGSFATSAITASSLITASAVGNTITFTKGDASTFDVSVSSTPIDTGSFATTASFNSYTQSNDQRVSSLETNSGSVNVSITNLNQATASLFGSASLGLVTASFDNGTRNLTFTKGDASTFNVNIPDVSGSAGDFVTTASFNAYTSSNDQRVSSLEVNSGSVNTSITNINSATASLFTSASLGVTTASVSVNVLTFTKGDGSTFDLTVAASGSSPEGTVSSSAQILNYGIFATTGSNTFTGNQTISTAGNSQLTLIAQPGFQTNIDFQSENSNFRAFGDFRINNNGQSGGSGSIKFTTSNNFMEFAADEGIRIGVTNGNGNGIDAGNISMIVRSGSLVLAPAGFSNNTASLSHLSSSSNTNFVNLIFKNSSTAADTIISGSNNIFVNPSAPTAGFKRYIGGSNNIINSTAPPQISGSMGISPTMSNNLINGGIITMRGPVSSSAWSISNNIVNFALNVGSNATNNAEKAVAGVTISSNIFNNTMNIIANRTLLTQPIVVSNNQTAFVASTLTAASSSILYQSNVGGINITNSASGGLVAVDANAIYVNANLFAGTGNSITATGSQDPGDTDGASYLRQIEQNQIFGNSNGVNLPYAPTGSNSLNQTMIAGYSLGVTGSNASSFSGLTPNQGSAFFGRYNAQDANRAQSAQTVFAVGTGDTTTRKTGFLIDSGSNSYFEGTLNVSGATSLNGDLVITGSLTASLQEGYVWVGNSSNISTLVATSSFAGGGGTGSVPEGTVSSSAQILNYGIFATTGSNTFTNKQTISANGIEITGSVNLSPVSVSTNAQYVIPFISGSTISKDSVDTLFYNPSFNQLLVSASTGVATISPNAITFISGSGQYGTYSTVLSKTSILNTIEGGNYIGISGNPSKLGAPSLASNTKPAILALSSSAQPYVAIELQASGSSFTDGRVTFPRNVAMLQNLEITGSLTASLTEGYVWVGDASGLTTTVATSSFGGAIDTGSFATTGSNSFVGNQTITGSLLMSGSADYDVDVEGRIRITGPSTGNTPRLLVSSSVNYTIVASNFVQVRQPSDNTISISNTFGGFVATTKESDGTEIGFGNDGSQLTGNWSTGPVFYVNNDPGDSYDAVFGFQDKTNYTDGRVTVLKPMVLNAGATVSGSINVVSGSITGQAVTNVTPVSSSLSPILNIVTLTTAEYALITPDSQTLYVIV